MGRQEFLKREGRSAEGWGGTWLGVQHPVLQHRWVPECQEGSRSGGRWSVGDGRKRRAEQESRLEGRGEGAGGGAGNRGKHPARALRCTVTTPGVTRPLQNSSTLSEEHPYPEESSHTTGGLKRHRAHQSTSAAPSEACPA